MSTLTTALPQTIEGVVSSLLAATELDAADLAERLASARDAVYWRSLTSDVTVDAPTTIVPAGSSATIDAARLIGQTTRDGYFHADPVVAPELVERMRSAVETIRSHGWHPAFALVYDEFWTVCHTPQLVEILTTLLGSGVRQTPRAWCHYVPALKGASGWPPHTDDRLPRRKLTVWIPLTRATIDNGCLYVVPRSRAPRELVANWADWTFAGRDNVQTLLQHARPLIADPGSVLGWEMDVLHWGSIVERPTEPRIAISFDFLSANELAKSDEQPLIAPGTIPAFEQRLRFIAQNLVDYSRFEPGVLRYRQLAERLLSARRAA